MLSREHVQEGVKLRECLSFVFSLVFVSGDAYVCVVLFAVNPRVFVPTPPGGKRSAVTNHETEIHKNQ